MWKLYSKIGYSQTLTASFVKRVGTIHHIVFECSFLKVFLDTVSTYILNADAYRYVTYDTLADLGEEPSYFG